MTIPFGQKHAPPVAKSVFSFASMRPGSKNGPFSYAAKLIGYRLGKIGDLYTGTTPSFKKLSY